MFKRPQSLNLLRRLRQAKYRILIPAALLAYASASAALAAGTIAIQAPIPQPPASLQLYSLKKTAVPSDAVNAKLRVQNLPSLSAEGNFLISRFGTGPDSLRAFGDPSTGFVEIIPNMSDLVKAAAVRGITPDAATKAAQTFLGNRTVIPADGTTFSLETPSLLKGSSGKKSDGQTTAAQAEKTLLALVAAHRRVGNYAVWGPGSTAVVSVDNSGAVAGLLRHWKTASPGQTQKTTMTADSVRQSILRQLRPATKSDGTTALVDLIDLGYYDGDSNYLQPVYRFEATVTGRDGLNPYRIAGFVPLVTAPVEALPDLAATPVNGPNPENRSAPLNPLSPGGGKSGLITPSATSIPVGQYINRDWRNDAGYTNMANAFMGRLQAGNTSIPGIAYNFSRTQYYEAWPAQLAGNTNLNRFNAVRIAYTVPHGDWLLNTTLSNYGDLWRVTDIGAGGTPGFGGGAGGLLATWIIASCEVLPSFFDRANEVGTAGNGYRAFDAWWQVFKGLHNAIGYRTIMFYPNTPLNNEFGYNSGLGGDVVANWFQAITAHGSNSTYVNAHLKNGLRSRYDRGSAMVDARNLGQSIYSINTQTAAGTLWNFWMGD